MLEDSLKPRIAKQEMYKIENIEIKPMKTDLKSISLEDFWFSSEGREFSILNYMIPYDQFEYKNE